MAREGVSEAEISVTFLDDVGIQDLNLRFLGRDRPTDVISFHLHEEGEPPLGDVYVGLDRARGQAERLGVNEEEEFLRLAIHGTLHVLGYDHPEGKERVGSPMFVRQEELVKKALNDGYEGHER